MAQQPPQRRGPPGLARSLGTTDAVVIGLGSMIGAGVFSAFGPAAQAAGAGLLVGLVIAAVVAYCNATSSAQLAAQYPTSGGSYVYGRERLGQYLLDIGLLRHDETSRRYVPTDPAAVQAQIVVPLGQQGADLLAESARWADAFSELGQVFRTSPRATVNPITEIHGLDNINNFIAAAVNDTRVEMLTAQPHGRRPGYILAVAEDRDVKLLSRGARMRTLYQHSARHSPATREYVADMHGVFEQA